jgi:hypothetical protein
MSKIYSPKIVTDSLVMCLDASQNKSYPTTDLPVKNGLVMWMDAADDTTFSYSSGTTVSQWRDKSGYNYHMVPKVNGPTRSVFLNSRKVLAFTAVQTIGNDVIDLSSTTSTVFVVSRYTSGTNQRVLTCNLDSGGGNWLLGHWGGYVNQYYAEGWVSYQVYGNDTVWRVYMGDYSGPPAGANTDLANIYSNGTAIVTNSTAASGGLRKLGINYYSNETSTCEVAEIIVFNRVLTVTERRLVHTYLGQKWGISNTDRSIVDLSNNNNHGLFGNATVANMPDYDFYNKGALTFNGTSDYVNLGNASSIRMGTSNFTISTWVKILTQTGTPTFKLIITSKNAAAAAAGYGFAWNNSVNKFLWSTANGSSSSEIFTTNTWSSLEGVWANIVMVRQNGATNNGHFYINGVYESLASAATVLNVDTATNMTIANTADLNSSYWFKGLYGPVHIYNKALSAAEVLQNYEAQKSKFANTIVQQGLVLNLDADNIYSYAGAGTTWYDVSGNGYQATMSNLTSANWVSYNGVRTFETNDTNDQGFRITSFPFPASRTYEIWINSKSFSLGWQTWFDDGGGERILFGTSTNTVHVYPDLNFTANLTVGTWYQLVYTLANGAGSACIAYVNGVSIGSGTYNSTIATSGTLYILGDSGGEITSCYCALARIYNRALSASEVLQNYNATKGRFGL